MNEDELLAALESTGLPEEHRAAVREALAAAAEAARLREELTAGLARYRMAVAAANPEVPEGLIAGDSFQAVDEALARARLTVQAVKERLQASQPPAVRVPAGATVRGAPSFADLSANQKIVHALRERAS